MFRKHFEEYQTTLENKHSFEMMKIKLLETWRKIIS